MLACFPPWADESWASPGIGRVPHCAGHCRECSHLYPAASHDSQLSGAKQRKLCLTFVALSGCPAMGKSGRHKKGKQGHGGGGGKRRHSGGGGGGRTPRAGFTAQVSALPACRCRPAQLETLSL